MIHQLKQNDLGAVGSDPRGANSMAASGFHGQPWSAGMLQALASNVKTPVKHVAQNQAGNREEPASIIPKWFHALRLSSKRSLERAVDQKGAPYLRAIPRRYSSGASCRA